MWNTAKLFPNVTSRNEENHKNLYSLSPEGSSNPGLPDYETNTVTN
jgi:hypothetical protein